MIEKMLHKLIVTGANGTGKSHLAARLARVRPDVPLYSYDAMKLTWRWQQRPEALVEAELAKLVRTDAWILEGGPSMLKHIISHADGLIWLDPPEWLRAWRLAIRPLRNFGRTRCELPPGNIDWPFQQYRFAFRSLRKRTAFRNEIKTRVAGADDLRVWHLRGAGDIHDVMEMWRRCGADDLLSLR